MNVAAMTAGALIGLLLYFLPSIKARGQEGWWKVFIANWIIGWTVIGWILVYLWVRKRASAAKVPVREHQNSPAPLLCTDCGKYSQVGAQFCSCCGAQFVPTVQRSETDEEAPVEPVSAWEWLKRITVVQWIVILVGFVMLIGVIQAGLPRTETAEQKQAFERCTEAAHVFEHSMLDSGVDVTATPYRTYDTHMPAVEITGPKLDRVGVHQLATSALIVDTFKTAGCTRLRFGDGESYHIAAP